MTNYEMEQAEYEALTNTPEARAVLGLPEWPPLPAAPVAPCFDPEWLPPVLRAMVEAVASNQNAPVDLPAIIGLGVSSACLCGRVSVRLKADWTEPAQLFLLGVMASGEGKTPCCTKMAGHLFAVQAEENKRRAKLIEADKAEMEVLQARKAAAVKKKETMEARRLAEEIAQFPMAHLMTRFTGGDATPEKLTEIMRDNDGATAILDDEGELFELLAGRYQDMPNLNPYLKGYSGGMPLTVERRNGSIIVDKPALSVMVLTQPCVVSTLRTEGRMRGKGLLARFLIACPEPVREYSPEPDIPPDVMCSYKHVVSRLLDVAPCEMTLSVDAREVFFAWRDEIRLRQWDDWNALQGDGYTAKLAGNTARLAANLCMWEGSGTVISAATMRNAVALARYFVGHMLHLIGTESGLTAPAKEALTLLMKKGQPVQKARELKRKLAERKLFHADGTADAALDELEKAGYIRREQEKGGGRPVLLVRLHPDLLPQKEVVDL